MALRKKSAVPECTSMEADDTKKKREPRSWNVRDSLGSLDAMRKYDAYLHEHARRLRQLHKEARGDMAPSGEWYRE